MINLSLKRNISRFFVFFLTILLQSTLFAQPFNGYTLINPMKSKETHLLDIDKDVFHSWTSQYASGYVAYLLKGGILLRNAADKTSTMNVAGQGGILQKIDWGNKVLWEFRYSTDTFVAHHDIHHMPNGNILAIAAEKKTIQEAIAAGRDPNSMRDCLVPDYIVEIKPEGNKGGTIVWEWHFWDHMIQDFDSEKSNYGVVKDHPELIDINFMGTPFMQKKDDWIHSNGLDYNEELDQIVISSHTLNEFYVIDHSTTTEEAKGHSGGRWGKGGDFLYRWGNPLSYKRGTTDEQKFFVIHDIHWVKKGLNHAGCFMAFNNGDKRPGGVYYSSIDIIEPPLDDKNNYILENDKAFGPQKPLWSFVAQDPKSFYAFHLGSSQRLPNGNTLISEATKGRVFEVDQTGKMVWEYRGSKKQYAQVHRYPLEITSLVDAQGPFAAVQKKPFLSIRGKTIRLRALELESNCVIYSLSGRMIFNTKIKANSHETTFSLTHIPTGIYSVIVSDLGTRYLFRGKLLLP